MQVTMMPKQPSKPLSEVQPDPQLEKRSRRVFTTDYKLKILAQADQCARNVSTVMDPKNWTAR
jgi:hypothetical protein